MSRTLWEYGPFLQALVIEWLEADPRRSARQLAKAAEVTHPAILSLKANGTGAGPRTAKALGKVFGWETWPQLDAAAEAWYQKHPDRRPLQDPSSRIEYPKLSERPEWKRIRAAVLGEREYLGRPGKGGAPSAIDRVGRFLDDDSIPRPLDPQWVRDVAEAWYASEARRDRSA